MIRVLPLWKICPGAATQIYDKHDVKDHPFQFNKNLLVSATHGIVINTHTKHQGNGKISYDQDGGYAARALSINEDVRLVKCICESCIYLNRLVQYSLHVHHYFLLHAVGVTSHEDILEKLRSEEAKSNMTRDGVVSTEDHCDGNHSFIQEEGCAPSCIKFKYESDRIYIRMKFLLLLTSSLLSQHVYVSSNGRFSCIQWFTFFVGR